MAANERFGQHGDCCTASRLKFELLLSSLVSVSSLGLGVAGLVHDEVAAHRGRCIGVVTSVLDRFEQKSRSLVQLLSVAQEGVTVSTESSRTSGTSPSMPLVPGRDSIAANGEFTLSTTVFLRVQKLIEFCKLLDFSYFPFDQRSSSSVK